MSFDYSLTRKQQQVLNFLVANHNNYSHPPTLDELCVAMGLKSRGSLHKHIQSLITAGLVESSDRKQRGVRLTQLALSNTINNESDTATDTIEETGTPFVGYIAAGLPIEAVVNTRYMSVPDEIKSDQTCYILQVKGDSMIDEGILDGDWVVIEQKSHAKNGDIVVALIDKTEATLKYIEQYPHEVILRPANQNMQAMHFSPHQVEIQGVLVGQMRSYK